MADAVKEPRSLRPRKEGVVERMSSLADRSLELSEAREDAAREDMMGAFSDFLKSTERR